MEEEESVAGRPRQPPERHFHLSSPHIQNTTQASLDTLGLQLYEVFPTEPLHDLKGHFSNIIDEALHVAPTETKAVVQHIKQTNQP